MKDVFQLEGDVAAKVAVAAVTSDRPEYKALFGSDTATPCESANQAEQHCFKGVKISLP